MRKATLRVACAALAVVAGTGVAAARWDDWVVKPRLRSGLVASLTGGAELRYEREVLAQEKTVLCGRFDAKVAGGAYRGFRRFVSTESRFAVEGESISSWRRMTVQDAILVLRAENDARQAAINVAARTGQPVTTVPSAEEQSRANTVLFEHVWRSECFSGHGTELK